jgi:hypothetical protein
MAKSARRDWTGRRFEIEFASPAEHNLRSGWLPDCNTDLGANFNEFPSLKSDLRNARHSTRSSCVVRASKVRLTFPIFECGYIKLKFRTARLSFHEVGPPEDQPRRISHWLHTSVRLLKPAQSRLICIPRWDLEEEKASQLGGPPDGMTSFIIEK